MKGAGATMWIDKMLRSSRIHITLVILIAVAAFFFARVHVAGGAELAAASASEGRRLAEALCETCHAIEPPENQPREHAESDYRTRARRRTCELHPQPEDQLG